MDTAGSRRGEFQRRRAATRELGDKEGTMATQLRRLSPGIRLAFSSNGFATSSSKCLARRADVRAGMPALA